MNEEEVFKLGQKRKVCLVGEASVGKTSLMRRYITDEFDEKYLTTIGTKVSKKQIPVYFSDDKIQVDVIMLIWDIMGQKEFRNLVKEAYFENANGILAVCDVTNGRSLKDLEGWVDAVVGIGGKMPMVFLANKSDLRDSAHLKLDDIRKLSKKYGDYPCFNTSAKTGENVEKAFKSLAKMMAQELIKDI